jgi:ectoine hydroxylase-related dioxygenase (phytanoyl-CoA dioxygenase family)
MSTAFVATLSDQQIREFCRQGYCVTQVPVSDEVAERAIEKVWELSPPSFRRDRPKSWQGMFPDSCKMQSIVDRAGRVKFRECLRGERWIYDLTAGDAAVVAAATDLIGDPVEPEYVRGLYPVFPVRRGRAQGHCDRHKFQVGVVLYLSDVRSMGGGFTVWPGSHHIMAKQHRTLGGEARFDTFEAALAEVQRSTTPVEIAGPKGTMVLWHHRLVHTAGINKRPEVRHATLCDFKNDAFVSMADLEGEDLWSTWSPRVKEFAAGEVTAVT